MTVRRRLDVELVRRGLAPSRAVAHAAIAEHRVTVGGALAVKPSRLVAPSEPVEVLGPPARFVGRGGEKLDAALTDFAIDVAGCRVLDAGASTGGFTDCLLQRGAAQVVAVDVGHGQLHPAIRDDPRVVVRERSNVRHLGAGDVGGAVDLVVADLSFISLRPGAPGAPRRVPARRTARAAGEAAVRGRSRRGLARPGRGAGPGRPRPRCRTGSMTPCDAAGATIMGWMESPLRGADGNIELFVHARAPVTAAGPP